MAQQVINNGEAGGVVRGKINGNFTELYSTSSTVEEQLLEWAQGKDYEMLSMTRDVEGCITTSTVLWPDGSAGTYIATDYNATHEVYDGYTIAHVDSTLIVTQSAVTRNVDGAVITKPALTVA